MRSTAALALLIVSTAAAASAYRLDPGDGVVLPENVAKEAVHQCSRGAPENVTGTWLPKSSQIAELESRLPAALEAIAFQRGSEYAQPADFRRQYTGLLVQGRKMIYVNAFTRESGDPNPNGPPGAWHFDWRRQVVVVCDGGPSFFGVEYDPIRRTFSHFEFNGFP